VAVARPFISVIVPVRNEAAHVCATLEQVLGQDYPANRFEVLVADGRSTDATRVIVSRLAERWPNLRLLDNPGGWSSCGRNRAIEEARGDVVLLVDGHCDLDNPRYLHNLAEAFARSGADCVGRPQTLEIARATSLQRAVAAARSSRLGHHPASFIYSDREQFVPPQSVAVAYRREVFATVGLFDESFDACEDVEFNHRVARAGLRCFFTPKVRARYVPRTNLHGLWRQMVRYGRGRVRLLRKHPETFSAAGFLPAAFLVGTCLGAVLACFSAWLAAAYLGVLGLYAGLVGVVSVLIALWERDVRLFPWLPLVFAVIHLGAGAGIVLEAVRGQPPAPGRAKNATRRRAA
jgi:succinoglycan biosynthesis protein ExoA